MQYYDQMEAAEDKKLVKKEDLLKRHREGYNFNKNKYKHD